MVSRTTEHLGKSWAILFDVLKYIDCPKYYAVFFRNTVKQIERTLWPEAKDMYHDFLYDSEGKLIGKAQVREKDKVIIFPSGAKIEFSFLENEAETKKNWQGAQITGCYMEEFGNHSEYNYNYLRTRLRSKSKYKSYMRCTLNPEPNHFVLKYLSRFINDAGFSDKELCKRDAYFIFNRGEVVTAWTKEEILEKFPESKPRLYRFVPSSIEDNPIMNSVNESYADDLLANDPANAELLLKGNWKYKPEANGVFDRSTIQVVNKVPNGCRYFRAYDKASSKPAKEGGDSKQLDPDYTCSVLFSKDTDGFVYVLGNYLTNQDGLQIARIREKPGPRDKHIEKQAYFDGEDVSIILPKDPGQAGATEFQESAKKLQEHGFTVLQDPSASNKSKRLRFEPFAAACYTGNVYWVKDSFDEAIWDYMILELENFQGDGKNNGYHDDLVDCFSSAYAYACNKKVIPSFSIPKIDAPTIKQQSGL